MTSPALPATSYGLDEALLLEPGDARDWQISLLQEKLSELELAVDDIGWLRMSSGGPDDFTRDGLRQITEQARLFTAKNPLVNRAVTLQSMYVFAQGMSVNAADVRVQELTDAFMDDVGNKATLTSHQARRMQEEELQVTGNLFFAMFVRPSNGRVRLRAIPFEEIVDVYSNPQDRADVWFYLRRWQERGAGTTWVEDGGRQREAWYPDWRHWQRTSEAPSMWGSIPVEDVPLYHVKVGAGPHQKYGLSEVYQALDWARAYKDFLTDWAALVRALSRFAWKVTVPGGQAARQAGAAKMGREPANTEGGPNRNAQVAGTFVANQAGANLEAIPKTGATVSAEDGRRLLLMVCAATGLPETFFGDVSVGTLATANSLDRPTELKFRDRQQLWHDIHWDILQFAVDMAIMTGALPGKQAAEADAIGEPGEDAVEWVLAPPEEWQGKPEDKPEEGDRSIDITFPPILEHDVAAAVDAAVKAVTLGGSTLNDVIITPEQAARLVLTAAGVDDVEEWLDEIFPVDEEGNPVLRADQVQREQMQAKADLEKLKIAGRVPPAEQQQEPGPNGGPPPPPPGRGESREVRAAAESLAEATRELIRLAETWKAA